MGDHDAAQPNGEYEWMMQDTVEPTPQQVALFIQTGSEFPLCVHHCPCVPWQVAELTRRELIKTLSKCICLGDLLRPLNAELSGAAGHHYLDRDDSTAKLLPCFKVDTIVNLSCEEDLHTYCREQSIMCEQFTKHAAVPPAHHSWYAHYMFFEVATDTFVLVSVYQPEEYHKEDYSWLMSSDEEEAGDEAPDNHQTSEDAAEEAGDADVEAGVATNQQATARRCLFDS